MFFPLGGPAMSQWLDTETRAILQGAPPEKLAPPDAVGFTLVLLSKTNDQERLRQALAKAGCTNPAASEVILTSPCPQVVAVGMTAEDAMLGQFELACCDSAAVFIRDEVVAGNDQPYLSDVYAKLSSSSEFQPVGIDIHSVPNDDQGRRYLQQFLGVHEFFLEWIGLPLHQTVMKKKARMMRHWGEKIGADVRMTKS
jgi:hypothetical protein